MRNYFYNRSFADHAYVNELEGCGLNSVTPRASESAVIFGVLAPDRYADCFTPVRPAPSRVQRAPQVR